MKKNGLIFVIAALLLSGCGKTSEYKEESSSVVLIHSDYPYYEDIESFFNASKAVVIGRVTEIENKVVSEGPGTPIPHYIYTVDVEKSFKSNNKSVYHVMVAGGKSEDVLYVEEEAPLLQKGDLCFWGLDEFDGLEYAVPLNNIQGMVKIDDVAKGVNIGKEFFSFD
jgi:hypothetical protein